MSKLTLQDLEVRGKRVLMRVDFNVPLHEDGSIGDDTRIRESLPSIRYVLEQGGTLVLMSHLGKSGGSLAPCAKRLSELLGKPVQFPEGKGEVVLLENLRRNVAEEDPSKDPEFAKNLAKLGDVYVNDAFGTAHRKHSSTYEIVKYFPGKAAMGFLMEKECNYLDTLLENPKRPFFAILGGAKVSSKIGVLKSLLVKADKIFVGGLMAQEVAKKDKIVLPRDYVCENGKRLDIGPQTIKEWSEELPKAKMIFWNGPLGMFETPPYDQGTNAIAHLLAGLKNVVTIVGGGDSVAAINALGLGSKFSHLSTGGGASLEYIEKRSLPGVDVLSNKN